MPNIFKSFLKPSFSKYVFPEAEDLQVELKEVPEELVSTEEPPPDVEEAPEEEPKQVGAAAMLAIA